VGRISDIGGWLADLGLDKYEELFVDNEIDVEAARDLTEADLKELGIAMGPRKKLLRAIASLDEVAREQAPDAPPPEEPTGTAERRQLTVLFCDLVGSTELSGKLDPEDLRDLMRRYQDAVAGAVARYDGYVGNFLGDGVVAYFGWPRAHEDQAAQAVRAGLTAIGAVKAMTTPDGDHLAARVGIASGQVVIGTLEGRSGRQTGAISGETPNLAARLQALAAPNEVVIGGLTRRLISELFALDDLGEHDLKGFPEPVPVWRVREEKPVESRFEAARGRALTRFVGRRSELGLLLERWDMAKGGEGQVVLLSGEAGIGKSRLSRALLERLAAQPHIHMRYQCSPFHVNSALYPVIGQLAQAARFAPTDSPAQKLDKLEALLTQADEDISETAPLIANLLSLPYEARYGALELTPERVKQRTLEALTRQLLQLAQRQPVLFLFEDVHWIDPTSQELLALTLASIREARVLVLATHRPEWVSPFTGHAHLNQLLLGRLARRQGAEIVRAIAGGEVSDDLIVRIVERTDGIPLFVEELTKSLVESGLDLDKADIPATLQASLLARLDRLGPETKEIAQIGAVVGREFRRDLLAAVADRPVDALTAALEQLERSELVFRAGAATATSYSFKHALIQDTAYDSLLRAERERIHDRIARKLVGEFQESAHFQPEVVAHHFEAAGQIEQAIDYYRTAASTAAGRSSNIEAAAHCAQALSLLEQLAPGAERDRSELDLLILYGPQQMLSTGLVTKEAEQTYRRAQELSQGSNDEGLRFRALWGLWHINEFRAEWEPAYRQASNLSTIAGASGDESLALQAHHAQWSTAMFTGDLACALQHSDHGLAIYDEGRHKTHAQMFGGHDPGVCANLTAAVCQSIQGRFEEAERNAETGVALAEHLQQASSLSVMHFFIGIARGVAGDYQAALTHGEAAVHAADSQGILPFSQMGRILRGWGNVRSGRQTEGLSSGPCCRPISACCPTPSFAPGAFRTPWRRQRTGSPGRRCRASTSGRASCTGCSAWPSWRSLAITQTRPKACSGDP
jgi:class 3 adenylate cyclase/tetratricopeptide (TPR) repeat protein